METSRKGVSFHQRINQIKRSKFGIYDLSTPEKTDTLLELGVALGMGKEVIVIYKKGFPLPETMKQLKRIEYEDVSDLTEKLRKKVSG
jgi:nucleoside 2-deoxyribosyltransferase